MFIIHIIHGMILLNGVTTNVTICKDGGDVGSTVTSNSVVKNSKKLTSKLKRIEKTWHGMLYVLHGALI